MSDSTIQYALDHRVLQDEKGNLLTDSAGNIIIPVMPLEVITQVADNHGNCSCGCLKLECNGYTESFRFCIDDSAPFRKDRNQFLATTNDIHHWRAVANLRNIVEASKGAETVSIKVYVGVNDFGTERRPVSGITATMKWGNKSVTSDTFYTCSMCRDPFFCGELTLDWKEKTLTLDTSNVMSRNHSDVCDPIDYEIIDIVAPYDWCYLDPETLTISDTVWTENVNGLEGALLWDENELSITVPEGVSIETAKIREAKGAILTEIDLVLANWRPFGHLQPLDRRDFIVTPDGLIYWRDRENYGIWSYTPIMVKRAWVYGAGMYASAENGLMVYCEGWTNAGWNNTGRVFGKALDSYDEWSITNEQIFEYSVENCLIAENIPFETDIHTFASKTGLFVINWEGADRFVRVVERTDPDNGEITSLSYDGLYATGESVTLDVPDSPAAEGYSVTYYETQTQDGKYKVWLGDSAAGRYFPGLHEKPRVVKKTVDGVDDYYYYVIEPGERYTFPDGSIGGFWFSCRNRPFDIGQSASFIIDGKGYSMDVTNGYSWVFDVKPRYAWSLAPCFRGDDDIPDTIYTNDIENPVTGDAYGYWNAETKLFTPIGTIAGNGKGIYAIATEIFFNADNSNLLRVYYSGATAQDFGIVLPEFE